MAKWGEGDERWIVDHRADGTNVNGWHWEEKNMIAWVKNRVEMLVQSELSADIDTGALRITSVKEIKGEASVSKRKGMKLFAMYDLTVTLKWSGELESTQATGEVKVTEFSSENEEEEFVVTVSADGTGQTQTKLKAEVERVLQPKILEKLRGVMADMIPYYLQQLAVQQQGDSQPEHARPQQAGVAAGQ